MQLKVLDTSNFIVYKMNLEKAFTKNMSTELIAKSATNSLTRIQIHLYAMHLQQEFVGNIKEIPCYIPLKLFRQVSENETMLVGMHNT